MPFEPLRFLHAADLRLDAPLARMPTPDEAMRRLAEDATLIALERLTELAVEQSVDFVLLAGECCDAPATGRAIRALQTAGRTLAEFGIPVFVTDAPRIAEGDVSSLAQATGKVVQSGHVVATLSLATDGPLATGTPASAAADWRGPRPFRIVCETAHSEGPHDLATADYLALHSAQTSSENSADGCFLHHPGTLQGLSVAEPGPRGCSLVEVAADGQIDLSFQPLAPVRWEQCVLGADPRSSRDALMQRMRRALLERPGTAGELACVVDWILIGTGEAVDSLLDAAQAASLWRDVSGPPTESGPRWLYRVQQRLPRAGGGDALIDETVLRLQSAAAGESGQEFAGLREELQSAGLATAEGAVGRIDRGAVFDGAARLCQAWLQQTA